MTDQSRQPGGIPAGGEFASKTHAEPDIELEAPPAAPVVLPSHLIDYLSGFGDGEEVTIADIERYFAERYEQAGFSVPTDAVEESDPGFEHAVTQLRAAQRAVLGASTVEIAKAVREAAPNAAVIVAVADDEYPDVVYLSEVRDAAGETIGERFDDGWVSKLDDDLREHLGNASVYGDYDLTGGEQLTLDVRDLIWSA
jgi:hypothetical protein